jgi:hypothetical protein
LSSGRQTSQSCGADAWVGVEPSTVIIGFDQVAEFGAVADHHVVAPGQQRLAALLDAPDGMNRVSGQGRDPDQSGQFLLVRKQSQDRERRAGVRHQ